MNSSKLLSNSIENILPYETISPAATEELGLYRIGTFNNNAVEFVKLKANSIYDSHIHSSSDAQIYIIRGNGKIILDNFETDYMPGDNFSVPKGISHGFKTKDITILLSIQNPPILDEKSGKMDLIYSKK